MTELFHFLQRILRGIRQWVYLRKWKRCRLKESVCEAPCEELGWCPYVDRERCEGCREDHEGVWE